MNAKMTTSNDKANFLCLPGLNPTRDSIAQEVMELMDEGGLLKKNGETNSISAFVVYTLNHPDCPEDPEEAVVWLKTNLKALKLEFFKALDDELHNGSEFQRSSAFGKATYSGSQKRKPSVFEVETGLARWNSLGDSAITYHTIDSKTGKVSFSQPAGAPPDEVGYAKMRASQIEAKSVIQSRLRRKLAQKKAQPEPPKPKTLVDIANEMIANLNL
jgi:hypothetical protein